MFKVGITGGMGSGKTLVSKVFFAMQIPVYDADSRAKSLMVSNQRLIQKIKTIFGEGAYLENGELHRKYISALAFTNKKLLIALNNAVHPVVFQDFEQWAQSQKSPYVIKEAALLLESEGYKQCDALLLVTADESVRVERVKKRDGFTETQILERMRHQMPEIEKREKAQYVIENNDNLAILPQIFDLHREFLQLAKLNHNAS